MKSFTKKFLALVYSMGMQEYTNIQLITYLTYLTLRPIVSNISTATYETAKYLASLLAPQVNQNLLLTTPKNSLNTFKNKM